MNDETPTGKDDDRGDDAGKIVRGSAERESPGRMLKAARERKGLSIEKLVAETALSSNTLAALEADDFEQLSQPVFVRGYYRKCAKVLDLDEDELMSAYAAHAGVSGPRPASPGQLDVIPQDVTPHSWRGLGLVLTVLAVLAILAAVWWLMPRDTVTGGEQPVPAMPAGPDDGAAAGDSEQASPDLVAENNEAPMPPAGGAEEREASGTPLQLRFRARSWVEVRDADGERLIADVLPAGSERTVVGHPPYEVLLGNAPGVEIRLDGERVAFGDRIRGDNTARLTIARDAAR